MQGNGFWPNKLCVSTQACWTQDQKMEVTFWMVWWQGKENCHFYPGGGQTCDTLREHQQSELNSCNSGDILWLSINIKELRKYSCQFTSASSANIKLWKNQGWGQALKSHLVKINIKSKRFLKCTEKNRYPLQWFIQSHRFKNLC